MSKRKLSDVVKHTGNLGEALFGSSMEHRYTLTRKWAAGRARKRIVWIMLNPSTADADQNDPTIARTISFSKKWAFSDLVILNIFALRSTDPAALKTHIDPIGPLNDHYIRKTVKSADLVVAGWGVHGAFLDRGREAARLVLDSSSHGELWCLGVTKDGHPKHPLYIAGDTDLRKFEM